MSAIDSQQRLQQLIHILADGAFHSGQSLADELNVSRTAIWKLVKKLQSWQIDIWSVRGKGYQVKGGVQLLDEQKLKNILAQHNSLFKRLRLFPSIDSTADYMANWWREEPGEARLCIAEHQSAGRGRKGRKWVSPFAGNFYFSAGMEMPLGLNALGGLSIAIGLGLAKTINQQLPEPAVRVKWPNDLLVNNKKLAGILVEASGDSNDTSFLNIGIGINWQMASTAGDAIDQPWINLTDLPLKLNSRQVMFENILLSLSDTLRLYADEGFEAFRQLWPGYSAWQGKKVSLQLSQGSVEGVEVGINEQGAIMLQTSTGTKAWYSGEVSLRQREIE